MLGIARDRGVPYINFYLGEDAYKLRWNPKTVPNHRMILGKSVAYWAPYAAYHVLRSKAVRYAKAEDSPQWTREAASRYRRLRYRMARIATSERVPQRVRGVIGRWFREV